MVKRKSFLFLSISLVVFLISTTSVSAYIASSTSYRLEKDSVNFGGTENSTSSSYALSDTLGESATGPSSGTTYNLHAGYRAMEAGSSTVYITLSSPSDIALSDIDGDTGGSSEGTATWTVTTNNANGYRLSIAASTDPALTSGANSFANYTLAGSDPDYTWAVDTSAAEFGFTPEGTHVVDRFLDNGSVCNTGSSDTASACWDDLATTTTTIAESVSSNNPTGTNTTVRVRAEIGSSATVTAGAYTSTLTVTAITL